MELRQIANQELIKELVNRIKTNQIPEQELAQILATKKKQRLAEYEAAANDPEENEELEDWKILEEELEDWKILETENWDYVNHFKG